MSDQTNSSAMATQLLQVLRRENNQLLQIRELLTQRNALQQDIQNAINSSGRSMDFTGLAARLEDEINELKAIKALILGRDELRQEIEQLSRDQSQLAASGQESRENNNAYENADYALCASIERQDEEQIRNQIENDEKLAKAMMEEEREEAANTNLDDGGGKPSSIDIAVAQQATSPSRPNDHEDADSLFDSESELESDDSDDEDYVPDEEDDMSDRVAIDRALEVFKLGKDTIKVVDYYDKTYELCCFRCLCENEDHDEKVKEILPSISKQSSSPYYARLHRLNCCNTVRRLVDGGAVTNYGIAVTTPPFNKKKKVEPFQADRDFLEIANKSANSLRTAVLNSPSCDDPVMTRNTDERYLNIIRYFKTTKEKSSIEGPKAANILSLFSGIGAGILVLKRLKIAINKCVVVEHDPIAEAVCRGNHRNSVDEYVWIKKFEDLERRLDEIMIDYGPINIVEGGPPCIEYSPINANRMGVESESGQYMPRFAQLCKKIKNHPMQEGVALFFLNENVPLRWEDMKSFEHEFGISQVVIDAQQMSWAKRKRGYFTNIPVDELPDPQSQLAMSSMRLSDGWMHPAQLYCQMHNAPRPYCKALTFLASERRLNDKRMVKVRLNENEEIETSHYSIADREKLLGFPEGYVERMVSSTFEKICASFHSEDWFENAINNGWNLDELAEFSACEYRFTYCDKKNSINVKIGTVEKNKKGKSRYCLDQENYCKRLLGNSYSIPVVEHLLRPLQDIFLQKEYNDAMYSFVWEGEGRTLAHD